LNYYLSVYKYSFLPYKPNTPATEKETAITVNPEENTNLPAELGAEGDGADPSSVAVLNALSVLESDALSLVLSVDMGKFGTVLVLVTLPVDITVPLVLFEAEVGLALRADVIVWEVVCV